jgi:indole-3-acetate monooxygenase
LNEDIFDLFSGKPSIPGPLYAAATPQFSLHIASVGIGIAQHAIDDIIALAGNQKRRLFAQAALADTPVFQHNLARARSACVRRARLVRREAESFWAGLSAGRVPTPSEQIQPSVIGAWAAATAAAVVDSCYLADGGTAIYDSSLLQHHLRDVRTITQHIGVADAWFTRAGVVLLGKDPGFGMA